MTKCKKSLGLIFVQKHSVWLMKTVHSNQLGFISKLSKEPNCLIWTSPLNICSSRPHSTFKKSIQVVLLFYISFSDFFCLDGFDLLKENRRFPVQANFRKSLVNLVDFHFVYQTQGLLTLGSCVFMLQPKHTCSF